MLTRNDIETALEYMDAHGLIRLGRQSGKWHQLYCPFHSNGQERKPSCGCSLEEETKNGKTYHAGQWHCFSCSASYSFSAGIKEILDIKDTSLELHPQLKKYMNDNTYSNEDNKLIPNELFSSAISNFTAEDIRSRILGIKKEYVSEQELASYRFTVPYMYQRKLTDEIIEKYDVGVDMNFIPPGRKKPLPCITFPVRDETGGTLFFCRRSIEGKFFNYPEGVEKPVYGIYELPSNCSEVIICESVFNALTCEVYGKHAVALLGTGNSSQIDQLKRLGVRSMIIALDNDEAGHRGAAKLKKALSSCAFITQLVVPNDDGRNRDINDLSYEEFMECYNSRQQF